MLSRRSKPNVRHPAIVAACLALLWTCAVALPCNMAWTQPVTLATATGIAQVNGLGLQYFPVNPETGVFDTSASLSWRLAQLAEVTPGVTAQYPCADQTQPISYPDYTIWSKLDIANSSVSCSVARTTRPVALGIDLEAITVTATWTEFPDFSLGLEVSTVSSDWNDTVGSGPLTDGLEYTIMHRSNEIKTTLKLTNWPWGPDPTSYLIPYFAGASMWTGSADVFIDNYQSNTVVTTQSKDWKLVQKQDSFVVLDGEPVLKVYEPTIYGRIQHLNLNDSFPFYLAFSICRHPDTDPIPHYNVLTYDPQFSSLFTGGVDTPDSPAQSPNSPVAKSTKGVAIAAGVTVPLVVLSVLGVALYYNFVAKPATYKAAKAALTQNADKQVTART